MPTRTVTNWRRRRGHELMLEDLEEILEELPERLLIGTGVEGRMRPDPSMVARLESTGVSVEALATHASVDRYRELSPRHTAAALHLTC